MKKVYCENCKYYKEFLVNGIIYDEYCKNNPTFEDSPISRNVIYSHCEDKNNNNDCKEFKPNFIYKLKCVLKIGDKNESNNNSRLAHKSHKAQMQG